MNYHRQRFTFGILLALIFRVIGSKAAWRTKLLTSEFRGKSGINVVPLSFKNMMFECLQSLRCRRRRERQ